MEPRTERWVDGDASAHLEELLDGELPVLAASQSFGRTADIELVGSHLRMSGTLDIGHFGRVSDYLNHQDGLITLQRATVLRRNGDPTKVTATSIWITPDEITLLAVSGNEGPSGDRSMAIPTVLKTIVVVTPGHTLTGNLHINAQAQLSSVIESPTPRFLALTDVRTRSLADRRVISRYDFAMLNRRHIVAATELQPGMIPGRRVL